MADHLLLISINAYRDWRPLRGPNADAEALREVLETKYGFAPERIRHLQDDQATGAGISATLRGYKGMPPEDRLVIFYAGHGYTDTFDRTGYWIPHDAEKDELAKRGWLPLTSARGALLSIPAKHILVICDACFSGDLLEEHRDVGLKDTPDYVAMAEDRVSREVLTSGSSEPVSDTAFGGHSPFAWHLVDTLRRGEREWVDAVRLYDRVRSGVRGQLPLYGVLKGSGHQQGGAFIMRLSAAAAAQATASIAPAVPPPVSAAPKVKCPVCGRRNAEDGTFECRVCRRDWLCLSHFFDERECCRECADKQSRLAPVASASAVIQPDPGPRLEAPDGTSGRKEPIAIDLGSGVKMEFAWIPPGRFTMGSPEDESERADDETQHQVAIWRGFWIGRYPVTQKQWETLMGENPSHVKEKVKTGFLSSKEGTLPDHPVENVSWVDCQDFLVNVNDRLVADRQHLQARLPTEAEWEYACRAGTTSAYYTGHGEKGLAAAGWYAANSGNRTHAVGQKKPNAWGLYDMHGNVWEWCGDWYGQYPDRVVSDPPGPSSGSGRVVRGGSWGGDPQCCRSANRRRGDPKYRAGGVGFRAVLSPRASV
jgi:formylglycine-generating enzyme required for sulfatase activity